MSSPNLWYYHEQLYRIVLESLEVSFMVCKAELGEYTIAKIFDVFSQILPTGFVLQTGFWPFFNTNKKQSICVCSRFGIDCRHSNHNNCHWLDLEMICNDTSMTFSSRIGELAILNYRVDVIPHNADILGYSISINLTMQYQINHPINESKKHRNMNIRTPKFYPHRPFKVYISCRYNLQREYYANWRSMMFQPTPFYHECYGSIFPDLLKAREPFVSFLPDRSNSYYTVTADNMPRFTLVLQEVNLPIYHSSEFLQVGLATTNQVRDTLTSLVPRQPSYPVNQSDNSYHQVSSNNIVDNTNRTNNNLFALEGNVNSTKTQLEPRKRNKKISIVELPDISEVNEAVPSCSNSQPQPSTSSVDDKVDMNQMDKEQFWQTLKNMYFRYEEQIKNEIERDFVIIQQLTDNNKLN